MRRIFHLFIIYILFQSNLLAQIPGFTQFNLNNGLPSNTVYDVNQDENGFLWIATDYGLSRFDGVSFKNFTVSDGIPDNEILRFFKDSKNRIWLVGFNGKVGYLKNNKFYNYNNQSFLKDLTFNNFVSDIFEDSKKNIWFLESLVNIKKLDSSNYVSSFNLKNPSIRKKSKKLQIVEDIYGEIKILKSATRKEKINQLLSTSIFNLKWEKINFDLYTYKTILELRNNKMESIKDIDSVSMQIPNAIFNYFKYGFSANLLYQSLYFDDSFLITNLNEGALLINSKDKYLNKKILPSVHTTRSYIDNEKNIWIGSQSNGIFLFPNLHINGVQFEDKNKNDIHTVSLFQNKLIIGNKLSEVVVLNAKTLKTIANYKLDKSPRRIRQLNIFDNQLFILGDYNIHRLNSSLKLERIKNMFDDDFNTSNLKNFKDLSVSKDFIYIANAGGIGKINKSTKVVQQFWNKRSTAIFNDTKENIWIGTTTGLYHHYKGITKKYKLNEQFDNSIIYAIENSPKGLLIGSNSYGFGILKNGKFDVISREDGLLSNYIKSIFIDTKNNIWLSTNFGLNCVELNDTNNINSIKSYTTSDGLYSNDVRASYVNENKVYVATSKGLNIINLALEKTSITTPKIYLNNILLNNKIIEKKSNQQFTHNLNNFQFNFSGISFKSLGNITFKYRLKGLESEWITTKTNTIRYSSLPPNTYSFELKAISKNNLESTPLLFSFTINPPIYKTWWFISISMITILTFITYFFYHRSLKIKRKQKAKEQISTLRYQALNAQMNPHFINNLLVNVHNLADRGAINEVKESLNQFAELVNLVLSSTKSNLINLSDEIEMAKLYLELQKLRFNKKTEYTINTKLIPVEELDTILVPPMILQPIIENSFKHGFKNENKTNTIVVDFKIENDTFLICEISDNGIGIKKSENLPRSKSSGISFSNINERLRLINESENDEKLIFISNITDEFDTLVGLKVTLKIPLISF
jgi:ligand-binding sensor domain-containing protein/two-component sensor histidine kinase